MTDTQNPLQDLTLFMWATPNSRRVSILFEELGLKYAIRTVNIRAGEQFAADIVALNPFSKIPIVVWQERGEQRVMFESGAILTTFAERFEQLLPTAVAARGTVFSWLMVAVTALGPFTGQVHHWNELTKEKSNAALSHYVALVERVYRLLDSQLSEQQYLADDYSIADIAVYPWIDVSEWTTLALHDFPNLQQWHKRIGRRAAVLRGMAMPAGITLDGQTT